MKTLRKAALSCVPAVLSAAMVFSAQQAAHAQAATEVNTMIPPAFANFGKTLANDGIYLSTSYTGIVLANVAGGLKTGTSYAGELAIGATFDLQKMAGLTGGSLHIIFDERSGNNANRWVGTNFGISENNGPNDVIRLSELYYEQALFNDRLDITFGRTNPTLDFATSNLSCSFVSNLFCAQPGIWYSVNSDLPYPLSEWGGRMNFQVTPDVYLRTGVYQTGGFMSAAQVNGQGFNWRWDQAHGVYAIGELGYQTKTAKYDLGGYLDGGSGSSGVYVQGQQAVWSQGPQSLTAFAGAMVVGGNPQPYWGEYYGGLVMDAPIVSRPLDSVGLAGMYIPVNRRFSPNSSESLIELYYSLTIMPGVAITPDVMYVIHPDEIGFDTTSHFKNAWLVGARFFVDLGEILKWPAFTAHD